MRSVNVFMEKSSVNSAFLFELSSQYRDRFFYAGKLSMKSLSLVLSHHVKYLRRHQQQLKVLVSLFFV